jgi:phage shock protein C
MVPDPDRDDADETAADEMRADDTKIAEPPPEEPLQAEAQTGAQAGVSEEQPTVSSTPVARRLHRSRDDRVIAGVCGGLAEYFGIDAVLMRIAFVLLVFAGGLGILAYVLGWIFIPEEPGGEARVAGAAAEPEPAGVERERRTGAMVLGLIFVVLGVLYLFDVAWPNFLSWRYIWPIALIAIGAAILLRARR